jgi:[calcium/calmodulin-dependent protein kinase] kinase
MISTEDNLYFIGKHVEEPTPDELRKAIGSLRSIL